MVCPLVDRRRVEPVSRVDADINCAVETVFDFVANKRELDVGIVASLETPDIEAVVFVQDDFLFVCVVGVRLLNPVQPVLFNEELTDVRDYAAFDGVVGKEFCALVNDG